MTELERLSFIHVIKQLEEENKKLKEETVSLRKLLSLERYRRCEK